MFKYYPMFIGIIDQLNEWNEKLNKLADEHLGNVGTGTALFFALVILGVIGVNTFNKKNQ